MYLLEDLRNVLVKLLKLSLKEVEELRFIEEVSMF